MKLTITYIYNYQNIYILKQTKCQENNREKIPRDRI